jgi:hypothetical protein
MAKGVGDIADFPFCRLYFFLDQLQINWDE